MVVTTILPQGITGMKPNLLIGDSGADWQGCWSALFLWASTCLPSYRLKICFSHVKGISSREKETYGNYYNVFRGCPGGGMSG